MANSSVMSEPITAIVRPIVTAGATTIEWTPECVCDACQALKADRPSQWGWLPRKLLVRYWAGRTDPLEKAFIRAHASWAQTQLSPEHLGKLREGLMKKRSPGGVGPRPARMSNLLGNPPAYVAQTRLEQEPAVAGGANGVRA
jgi:hypothetical protein